MPRVLRFCLALWLASTATARAQDVLAGDDCASFCLRAPGGYVLTGVSLWPTATGMAFTAGIFHNRLFGAEVGAWVPIGGLPDGDGVLGSMVGGRVTLLRTRLDGDAPIVGTPQLSLVLSARAGFALLFTDDGALLALGLGPSADLVLFDVLVVSLRPLLAVRPDGSTSPGAAPLRAFPLVELSLGLLASDGCMGGLCLP